MQKVHATKLRQVQMQREPNATLQPDAGGDRLLTMKAVIDITSWSRTSINRLIQEGRFHSH